MGTHTKMAALKRAKFPLPVEVYPLIVAVGFGSALCVGMMTRTLVSGPDVHVRKAERQSGLQEDEKDYLTGEHWHRSPWRAFFDKHRGQPVVPGLDVKTVVDY